MGDLKKLGANIRSLRIAYGETQEQLGEAIYVEKNTVRNREVIDILIVPTCSIVSSAGINSIFPSTETVNAEKT